MFRFAALIATLSTALIAVSPTEDTTFATRSAHVDTHVDDLEFAGQLLEERALAEAIDSASSNCAAPEILSARTTSGIGGTVVVHHFDASDLVQRVGNDAEALSRMPNPYTATEGEAVRVTAAVNVRCRAW